MREMRLYRRSREDLGHLLADDVWKTVALMRQFSKHHQPADVPNPHGSVDINAFPALALMSTGGTSCLASRPSYSARVGNSPSRFSSGSVEPSGAVMKAQNFS